MAGISHRTEIAPRAALGRIALDLGDTDTAKTRERVDGYQKRDAKAETAMLPLHQKPPESTSPA
jgi:hypothetical protein